MRRATVVFWGSAVLVAAAFAALVPLVFPYGVLRLVTEADRERAWMLTVFCTGVMAVMFGLSGALGGPKLIGYQDVMEAGSIAEARARVQPTHADREARRYERNFGVWLMVTGAFLIAIYFGLWIALR